MRRLEEIGAHSYVSRRYKWKCRPASIDTRNSISACLGLLGTSTYYAATMLTPAASRQNSVLAVAACRTKCNPILLELKKFAFFSPSTPLLEGPSGECLRLFPCYHHRHLLGKAIMVVLSKQVHRA